MVERKEVTNEEQVQAEAEQPRAATIASQAPSQGGIPPYTPAASGGALSADFFLQHETTYTQKPSGRYEWKCSCGNSAEDFVSWDECHRFTRMHWSGEINALLAAHDQKVREAYRKGLADGISACLTPEVDPMWPEDCIEAKEWWGRIRALASRTEEDEPNVRYAAYANHCAIQKKVPESFYTWRKWRDALQ